MFSWGLSILVEEQAVVFYSAGIPAKEQQKFPDNSR
jgi:hypothetical protein